MVGKAGRDEIQLSKGAIQRLITGTGWSAVEGMESIGPLVQIIASVEEKGEEGEAIAKSVYILISLCRELTATCRIEISDGEHSTLAETDAITQCVVGRVVALHSWWRTGGTAPFAKSTKQRVPGN
jgi:hypothetical protein